MKGYIIDGVYLEGWDRLMLKNIDGEDFAYGLGDQDTDAYFVLDGFYGSIFC